MKSVHTLSLACMLQLTLVAQLKADSHASLEKLLPTRIGRSRSFASAIRLQDSTITLEAAEPIPTCFESGSSVFTLRRPSKR